MSVYAAVELFPDSDAITEILLDACDARNYFKPYTNGAVVWFRAPRKDGKGVRQGNELWDCLKVLLRVIYGFTYKQLEEARLTQDQRIQLLQKWVRIGRVVSYEVTA